MIILCGLFDYMKNLIVLQFILLLEHCKRTWECKKLSKYRHHYSRVWLCWWDCSVSWSGRESSRLVPVLTKRAFERQFWENIYSIHLREGLNYLFERSFEVFILLFIGHLTSTIFSVWIRCTVISRTATIWLFWARFCFHQALQLVHGRWCCFSPLIAVDASALWSVVWFRFQKYNIYSRCVYNNKMVAFNLLRW